MLFIYVPFIRTYPVSGIIICYYFPELVFERVATDHQCGPVFNATNADKDPLQFQSKYRYNNETGISKLGCDKQLALSLRECARTCREIGKTGSSKTNQDCFKQQKAECNFFTYYDGESKHGEFGQCTQARECDQKDYFPNRTVWKSVELSLTRTEMKNYKEENEPLEC